MIPALTCVRLEDAIAEAEKKKASAPKRRKKTKNDPSAALQNGEAGDDAGSPAGGKEPKATQRKCANCGQVGHIKTNKKSVDRKCRSCKLPMNRVVVSGFMAATGMTDLATGWRD